MNLLNARNEPRGQGLSQACVAGGRAFVVFATILVVVMPLTEYYWTFDKFLRGGHDMEFGMLTLAALLCLILVLSLQRKRRVVSLLAARQWLWSLFKRTQPLHGSPRTILAASNSPVPLQLALAGYGLSLQI